MVNLAFKAPEPAAKLTAEEQYQDLTEQVVNLTSYHVLSEESGELVQRQTRESNFRAAIRLINERLDLGLDRTESEMLTLVYTALSEAPRFLGNDHLEARKGGNTGQHSIHTPLRAKLLVDRALEQLESDDTPEAIKLRKVTGLALMLHDFGESLGEPGTLEQESKNASFQKDKPAAERLIMEGILYHAAAAVESGNYTKFYNRLDEMKIPDTSGKAQVESNEEFLAHVKERLGELPAISAESEARVDLFRQFWDLQEKAGNVPESLEGQINSEFIRNLCGLSEHMQGEGYFLAMLQRDDSPENASGPASWSRVRSKYQLSNLKYNEGEVGNLFAHASTPLEKAVALEAKKEAYAKSIEFLELGSAAVDRFATPDSELSPKDPNRTAEIEALVEKSEAQGAELAAQGKGHEVRPIETRERLVAMYKWALENDDFIPGPGQILVLNPPAEYRFDEPKKGFAGKVAAERAAPKETGLSA